MSRTHKTKRYTIQMYQKHCPVEEVHDHSKEACDLPEFNPKDMETRTRCYWTWGYNGKNYFCGCRLCTGHNERIQNNRRDRKYAKQRTHDWTKDPELYDEEVIEQKRELW